MKDIPKYLIIFFIIFFLPVPSIAAQKTMTTYAISPTPTYPNNANSPYNTTSATSDKNFGVTKTGLGAQPTAGNTSTSAPITDTSFPPSVNTNTAATTSAIAVDPSSATITLINSANETSGVIWYGGTSTTVCNACTDGVCPFGIGFRAYFEFKTLQDTSTRSDAILNNGVTGPGGDGFTFSFINASNNTTTARGGVPTNGFSMGSLLGYAGPGNTTDKLGLKPPKFAIEFDLYPSNTRNTCSSSTSCVACPGGESGYCDVCSGGRYDNGGSYDTYGSSGNTSNHISLMLWGANPASTFMCRSSSNAGSSYPQAPMDDTYHGAGDGTTSNPYNSSLSGNGSGLGGYYERSKSSNGGTYNWMEDGQWHRARIEVIRDPAAYTYRVKAWVDCENYTSPYTACPATEYVYFQDIYTPYTNATYLPKIDRTVTLTQSYSNMLNSMIFGFTEGSGQVTQTITITNFAIYFPTFTVGTASNLSFPGGGGSGTVPITALSTCPWTTSNNGNTWITVTPASNNGNGSAQTVTYTLAANTGSTVRTGVFTVGDKAFTVTQAACTYTVGNASNLSFAAGGGSGTVSVTASSDCPWTTSNNGYTWITVTPASNTGTGSAQTVNYTIAANTGAARTGTFIVAGRTFAVNQAAAPPSCTLTAGSTIVPYNGTTTLTWTVSGTPTSATWTSSPGGTCGSPNVTGGSCTTAAQTTAGTRTSTLTVSNTNGSSSCSSTYYVGCQGYTVYNNTGSRRDFRITNSACSRPYNGSAISGTLNIAETATRYNTNNTTCGSAQGSITYTDAMNADIAANGGNGNCQVYYNSNDTASDR